MHIKVDGVYLLRETMLSDLGVYVKFAYKSGGETKPVFTDGWISKAQNYFMAINREELVLFRKFFIKS